MNRKSHIPKPNAASRAFLLVTIVALSLNQSSLAADPFRYDWIVRMKAERLQRQFVYRGSSLDKVAKITIDYYRKEEPDNKTLYELLWFNDGKPIGLERKNEFKIPAGKTTRIEVQNKKETTPETEKAIADAILRISLDAYRKRTAIVSIKVPIESFEGIVAAMNQLNCVESQVGADEFHPGIMTFPIETDENGPSKTLYFY